MRHVTALAQVNMALHLYTIVAGTDAINTNSANTNHTNTD